MISVIIPTYNGANILEKTLPQWLSQNIPRNEYEVYVVDNRSSDNTHSTVERIISGHSNFHYLYEEAPGATAARHAGVKASKGDILVFADNDVLVNPDCLQGVMEVYVQNPDCVAVTGRIRIQWDKEEPDWITPYKYLFGALDYGEGIRYGYDLYLNGGFMSVKRDVFERLHGFNPDLVGPYLIGDGDTGLVKKLFKEHLLIGYTPYVELHHLQQTDKHGSVEGVALHFYNNGVAESYSIYRDADFRFSDKVFCHLLKESAILFKQWVSSRILHRTNRHLYFTMRQHAGCVRFFFLLLNPQLRKEIQVKNVYN